MNNIVGEVAKFITNKPEQFNISSFTYFMHLFSFVDTIEVKIIGHMGTHSNIL